MGVRRIALLSAFVCTFSHVYVKLYPYYPSGRVGVIFYSCTKDSQNREEFKATVEGIAPLEISPSTPVTIIVHGYTESSFRSWVIDLTNALLTFEPRGVVILVDYWDLTTLSRPYMAENVRLIANLVVNEDTSEENPMSMVVLPILGKPLDLLQSALFLLYISLDSVIEVKHKKVDLGMSILLCIKDGIRGARMQSYGFDIYHAPVFVIERIEFSFTGIYLSKICYLLMTRNFQQLKKLFVVILEKRYTVIALDFNAIYEKHGGLTGVGETDAEASILLMMHHLEVAFVSSATILGMLNTIKDQSSLKKHTTRTSTFPHSNFHNPQPLGIPYLPETHKYPPFDLISRLSEVHLIGFSLGGRISGIIGGRVKSGKIGRITGLDASYPWAQSPSSSEFLDASDAKLVVNMRTSPVGSRSPPGHIDFYAHDGLLQPGCDKWYFPNAIKNTCSHYRSVFMLIEAVQNAHRRLFPSCSCESWEKFQAKLCDCQVINHFGLFPDENLRGTFYLTTNAETPYSRPLK
ncbi:uncharacterized protein LOC119582293 [Penaeus monodon]|uniref:uncharacterized protein LOC119582293 n=1 Tax=Penaeus monodon TaxID=6687 RepID=UPI0018A785D3|nr:uncharacterized protein LOC119582293 [Penaeus monodon]